MKTAIAVGGPASGQPSEFARLAAFAVEAEKLGVDSAWSAEAWGYDAVSILAYLAAKTERLVLGSGILQISARAPAMTAMTAMALAALSGNRFILGLGASGPQVVEGLHGVAVREAGLAHARDDRDRAARVPRRAAALCGRAPRAAAARRRGQGAAPRAAGQPEHPDLPRHAVAEGARAHGRARRRLARHLVHARGRRGAPRATCGAAPSAPGASSPTSRSASAARSRSPTIPSRCSPRRSRAWRSRSARWAPRRPTSTTTPFAAAASRTPRSRCSGCGSTASARKPRAACPTR